MSIKGSGLEYTLAVTHLPTFNDVMEEETLECTCCPEAVQRTLATMLDMSLLSSPSFMLLCFGGFFTCMGFYVPFMFIESKFLTLTYAVLLYFYSFLFPRHWVNLARPSLWCIDCEFTQACGSPHRTFPKGPLKASNSLYFICFDTKLFKVLLLGFRHT